MVGKIRLHRKATKGKIWKKGHSSSFNPEFCKFRNEAKRTALYGYQVGGNLTKKALEKLDALNGDQIVASDDDDATSIGNRRFVTTFSDCSNPTFSRIEDILEDSGEEKSPKKLSKRPKKHVNDPWIEEQGENDIVDLLDPAVNRKILASKPKLQKDEKPKLAKNFPTAPDGRLIIKEEEEEQVKSKKRKTSESADISLEESLEYESKKRKLEDLSDDELDTVPSKYQPGGKGIHRNFNKHGSSNDPGTEYKAKKAGGDIKKGKYEPFAYFPLNKQTLNKRKRGKLASQFKGVVSAAKRGAQKGTKAKAMIVKRKKINYI